jgi:hypothetical protein
VKTAIVRWPDLIQIEADPETAAAVLDRVPLWFHTFSLDRSKELCGNSVHGGAATRRQQQGRLFESHERWRPRMVPNTCCRKRGSWPRHGPSWLARAIPLRGFEPPVSGLRIRFRYTVAAGSRVLLFTGTGCHSLAEAIGTVSAWNTESFSAIATDATGNASGCSSPISYTQQDPHPSPPGTETATVFMPPAVLPRTAANRLRGAKSHRSPASAGKGGAAGQSRLLGGQSHHAEEGAPEEFGG